MRALGLVLTGALVGLPAPPVVPTDRAGLPFGPGEEIRLRITWAHLLAGRGRLAVEAAVHQGRPVHQHVLEVKSEGFFAWLTGFHVQDRTVATWDPAAGCSLKIEKHLKEGGDVREQVATFDPVQGTVELQDSSLGQRTQTVGPCTLDVLSAFLAARARGWSGGSLPSLPVFDNGKRYEMGFRELRRERLDLPPPLGRRVAVRVFEVRIPPGSGLFTQEGPLSVWVTDDARRIPVRMRSKVKVGSVSADLESYRPPSP